MKFYEYKYETSISNDMKLLTFNSNKYTSYYDQPSADIIKWIPLKSPEKHSHASQFTKHLSFMTLEGSSLLQIQRWWDASLFAFREYLSTYKIYPAYKYIKS